MQTDPVFGLPTPLVFAHRGGAGEVPESTELAFRHAVEAGVDVLEFDLNLTNDGKIVVWHGPDLDNVYVGTQLLKGQSIEEVSWEELGNARVVDPRRPDNRAQDLQRKLLLLEDFVRLVQRMESERARSGAMLSAAMPWNIELKGKLERWEAVPQALPELFRLLDAEVARRKIVLAALRVKDVQRLRQATTKHSRSPAAYASNLAGEEQLPYRKWMRLGPLESLVVAAVAAPFSAEPKPPLEHWTLETAHALVDKPLVEEVHRRGGAIHAFLTPFAKWVLPGVDHKADAELEKEIRRLLETGIDGIMTDYPARVVPIVKKVQQARGASTPPARGVAAG